MYTVNNSPANGQTRDNRWHKNPIFWIVITIIVTAMVSYYLNSYDDVINNLVTLVVEVGIGIIIAIVVYSISKKSESKTKETIENMFRIVHDDDMLRKNKEHEAKDLLYKQLSIIKDNISQIQASIKPHEESKDAPQESHKHKIFMHRQKIIDAFEELNKIISISQDFFSLEYLLHLKTLSDTCKNRPDFEKDDIANFYDSIKKAIEPLIAEYRSVVDATPIGRITETSYSTSVPIERKEPHVEARSKSLRPKKELLVGQDDSLSVSADRTVYPTDSIIHVRTRLDRIIEKKEIVYEVFNSKKELLASRTLLPQAATQITEDGSMFQTDFKMDGDKWVVGDEYVVRATYHNMYAEDSFTIDQRVPIIQSDKSVYTIGSDVILTVIDPDADKDSDVAEYVGNRNDSKLIIESPHGRIDGYKLKETGDSTGIFQGIIGIIGIKKNGKVIPYEFDGKIIDKIQGSGIDDGFIGGRLGDELSIRYTNRTGTVYLKFFISSFGGLIELDQETYRPMDKVHIMIVAPDLSFDSKKTNKIGGDSASTVDIRTSKDRMEKFQMAEIGPDAGIFVGEIQLECEGSNIQANHTESTGHRILCDNDDFIEISFKMFDDERIIKRATIKNN